MTQHKKLKHTVTAFCCVIMVLFFLLYSYLFFFENISVSSSRHAHTYDQLTGYSVTTIEDTVAPVGIRKEYRLILNNFDSSESCLCFYLVHQYADVYIDGELVYTLTASENNRISDTISSNWATIPIHENDSGKELVVVLTPLYKSMTDFEPKFLVGSHYSIVVDQFKQDIPQLFIALLCVILSIFILITQIHFMLHTNTKTWNMLYLAGFAFLLGSWRITDTKSSPILFANNPLVLGYISIGCLFLCSLFLQLYLSTCFAKKYGKQLLVLTSFSCSVTFMVWLFQIFDIADFKQMLPISHFLLIVSVAIIIIFSIICRKEVKNSRLFLILALGIAVDIASFYIHRSSAHVMFTVVSFIIYTIIVYVTNMLDTTKKATLDSPTGLINKSRWNELIQTISLKDETVAITMIDLNNLKQVNDTYGHEIGDRMIFEFSKMLKTAFPSNSTLCRWGGDEFVIMTENKYATENDNFILKLQNFVDTYNADPAHLKLSFAVGYCTSTEFPKADFTELVEIADKRMYENKIQIKMEQV